MQRILDRSRELVLGREAIVDRRDDAPRTGTQMELRGRGWYIASVGGIGRNAGSNAAIRAMPWPRSGPCPRNARPRNDTPRKPRRRPRSGENMAGRLMHPGSTRGARSGGCRPSTPNPPSPERALRAELFYRGNDFATRSLPSPAAEAGTSPTPKIARFPARFTSPSVPPWLRSGPC
jgi:hypothetical protein